MGLILDPSGFMGAMNTAARYIAAGELTEAAVRPELGQVLMRAIDYTPAADAKAIKRRADFRFSEKYALRGKGDLKVSMNDGSRKGEAVAENVWMRSGGKFYIMRGPGKWPAQGNEKTSRYSPSGAHWPDRIWQQYQSLIDQTPEELARIKKEWEAQALDSRGLAKASWGQIAQKLELPGVWEYLPAYAREAKGSDGRSYINGTGDRQSTETRLTFTLTNSMPALTSGSLDGEGILQRAFDTRETAIMIALEKGVFDDLEKALKPFPGLSLLRG